MARRTISELQDQLDAERQDNERLYGKIENLRSELSGVAESADDALDADDEDSDDDSDSDSDDDSSSDSDDDEA